MITRSDAYKKRQTDVSLSYAELVGSKYRVHKNL